MIPSARAGLGVASKIKANNKIEMRGKRNFFMSLSLGLGMHVLSVHEIRTMGSAERFPLIVSFRKRYVGAQHAAPKSICLFALFCPIIILGQPNKIPLVATSKFQCASGVQIKS